jgi:RNA polymerase sigma factor (sigma-70 family)
MLPGAQRENAGTLARPRFERLIAAARAAGFRLRVTEAYDGDLRNPRTRAGWIAFRRWVAGFEGGRFRLLGTPDAPGTGPTSSWLTPSSASGRSRRCWRRPGGKSCNYIGRMTFEEAGQHLSVALEAALSRYGSMVRQVGRKYRLDESDLDEVMQEVRIRLWRARGTSEMVGEANTSYIYRTASTAALDVLRRRRARQADRHDPIEEGPVAVLSAPTPDPHGVLEGSELASKVAQAIETIAESRRPAVRMHLAGYPREEIASLMGWTEAKTRNLLYRGLADLRERLAQEGIGWDTTEA